MCQYSLDLYNLNEYFVCYIWLKAHRQKEKQVFVTLIIQKGNFVNVTKIYFRSMIETNLICCLVVLWYKKKSKLTEMWRRQNLQPLANYYLQYWLMFR